MCAKSVIDEFLSGSPRQSVKETESPCFVSQSAA